MILVRGRSGTLGEFAIAYDEAKLIGVLQETGGVADHVDEIVEIVHKETGAGLIFDARPERLMARLLRVHKTRSKSHPRPRPASG